MELRQRNASPAGILCTKKALKQNLSRVKNFFPFEKGTEKARLKKIIKKIKGTFFQYDIFIYLHFKLPAKLHSSKVCQQKKNMLLPYDRASHNLMTA